MKLFSVSPVAYFLICIELRVCQFIVSMDVLLTSAEFNLQIYCLFTQSYRALMQMSAVVMTRINIILCGN